jgi:hypothetical protein
VPRTLYFSWGVAAQEKKLSPPSLVLAMVSFIPLVVVGLYEMLCWWFDVFGVHALLNQGKPMTILSRFLAGLINGGMWLLLAVSLAAQWPYVTAVLLNLVSVFCCMQWIFWWWPYLLGSAGLFV